MYGSFTVLPPAVLSILEPRYLVRNCLHRVKNSICLLARKAFSSYGLKPYLSLFVRFLKSYANEVDCKQWRQQKIRLYNSGNQKLASVVFYMNVSTLEVVGHSYNLLIYSNRSRAQILAQNVMKKRKIRENLAFKFLVKFIFCQKFWSTPNFWHIN